MGNNDTRRNILEGAFGCFSRRDYHEVKIADVADEAGVGKGTVYEYFSSKKELYNQLFIFMGELYLEEMQRVVPSEPDFPARLKKLYITHAQFHRQLLDSAKGLILLEEMMNPKKQKELYPIGEKLRELCLRFIIEGKKAGECRQNIDEELASHFLVMGLPCMVYAERPESSEKKAGKLVDFVLHGLV